MASPFENVAEQALSLSAAERLRLATELLESVEPSGSKGDVERAWKQEIQRRITEIDAGNAPFSHYLISEKLSLCPAATLGVFCPIFLHMRTKSATEAELNSNIS